ncbi:MAG: cysteine-rich CWC family protein [Chlorobium sp.]|nr:cysteine-rich CWC family protein [Chlorobium phaeovibrioides]NQU45911.1 cysteine-rich CWC family protein [Chlorobium sp.]
MTHSGQQESNPKTTSKSISCPICGALFTCDGSVDCWCASRTVPVAVLEDLSRLYDTCICPACLDRLIAEYQAG